MAHSSQAGGMRLSTGKVPTQNASSKKCSFVGSFIENTGLCERRYGWNQVFERLHCFPQHWLCFQADFPLLIGKTSCFSCGLTSRELRTTPSSLIPSTRYVIPQAPPRAPGPASHWHHQVPAW